jgi:hypothetical protein
MNLPVLLSPSCCCDTLLVLLLPVQNTIVNLFNYNNDNKNTMQTILN